jgi:hypothetical protein
MAQTKAPWFIAKYGEVKKAPRRRRIRSVSPAMAHKLLSYKTLRREFLSRPENKWCPVFLHLTGEKVLTTDIHHTRGRSHKLLNNMKYWIAVSRKGHDWIGANPAMARKLGFLCEKGKWNETNP